MTGFCWQECNSSHEVTVTQRMSSPLLPPLSRVWVAVSVTSMSRRQRKYGMLLMSTREFRIARSRAMLRVGIYRR